MNSKKWLNRATSVICIGLLSIALAACGVGSGGRTALPSTVVVTVDPAGPINAAVGESQAVRVAFTTTDGGAATNLNITVGLSTLPAGWTTASPGFSCSTVGFGSTCVLELSYAPVAPTPSTQLTFTYRYTDGTGAVKTADFSISYSGGPDSPSGSQKTAYILNDGSGTVSRCAIAAGGSLDCSDLGSLGLNDLSGIAINGSTAYIASSTYPSPQVFRCTIAAGGSLSGCIDSNVPGLTQPIGTQPITLDINGSFLYASHFANHTIVKCAIAADGTGTLTDCQNSGATGLVYPSQIVFSGSSAYVLSSLGQSITRCAHNAADGSLSQCAEVNVGGLLYPHGVAINGPNLYIANSANNVIRCTIGTTGSLTNCTDAGAFGLVDPVKIAITGSTAYVLNYSNNDMSASFATRCTIATGGSFIDCANSGATGLAWPSAIAIK